MPVIICHRLLKVLEIYPPYLKGTGQSYKVHEIRSSRLPRRGKHLAQLALVSMICTIAVPSCGDGRQALPDASQTTPDAANLPDGEPPPAAFVALASGHAHTCYIDNGHALWCWGDNNHGSSAMALAYRAAFQSALRGHGARAP